MKRGLSFSGGAPGAPGGWFFCFLFVACGPSAAQVVKASPEATLDTADQVKAFSPVTSASFIYDFVVGEASGEKQPIGSVEITGDKHDPDRLVFHDYGSKTSGGCMNLVRGTFSVVRHSETSQDFETAIVFEATCAKKTDRYAVEFAGSMEKVSETARVFSGSGTLAAPDFGRVSMTSNEERVDSAACRDPLSGTTQLASRGTTILISYDGAQNCDGVAPYSKDGVDQGTTSVQICGSAPPGFLAYILLPLGVLFLRRRR
jgi:hypothetical protein